MLDRFFNRDDSSPDEFVLIRTSPDQTKVRSFDDPVQPAHVRLNEPDLKDGVYQLQELCGGQFGNVVWKETFGDPNGGDETAERVEEEVQRLRQELRAEQSDESAHTAAFSDPTEKLAYQIVESAISNEEIMRSRGDQILSRALDRTFGGGEPSVDYEIDSEFQATLHELRRNPERAAEYASLAGDLANNLGQSFGAGLSDGFNAGEPDTNDADTVEDQDDDLETTLDGVDVSSGAVSRSTSVGPDTAGPTSLDELGDGAADDSSNVESDGEQQDAEGGDGSSPTAVDDVEEPERCTATTKDGTQCQRNAATDSEFCHQHQEILGGDEAPSSGKPTPDEVAEVL